MGACGGGVSSAIEKTFRNLFAKSQQHGGRLVPNRSGSAFAPFAFDTTDLDTWAEGVMHFVAGALAILSGLFYAADHNEIGSLGVTMCRYGGPFCDNPSYVFVAAVLAALWGTFVSVR
jgi:hypothetical protein